MSYTTKAKATKQQEETPTSTSPVEQKAEDITETASV